MNARVITNQQQKWIEQAVQAEFVKRADDLTRRAQYLWAAAMLDIGLKPSTVNKVIAKIPAVTEYYAHYATDKLADYIFHEKLSGHGVNLEMTEEEN